MQSVLLIILQHHKAAVWVLNNSVFIQSLLYVSACTSVLMKTVRCTLQSVNLYIKDAATSSSLPNSEADVKCVSHSLTAEILLVDVFYSLCRT